MFKALDRWNVPLPLFIFSDELLPCRCAPGIRSFSRPLPELCHTSRSAALCSPSTVVASSCRSTFNKLYSSSVDVVRLPQLPSCAAKLTTTSGEVSSSLQTPPRRHMPASTVVVSLLLQPDLLPPVVNCSTVHLYSFNFSLVRRIKLILVVLFYYF